MGERKRSTRECTFNTMRPELVAAINAHVERYELEDVLASAMICCETVSTKEERKPFGSKREVEISGTVLTPKWLITAGGKENEVLGAFSARLQDLRVEDYEKTNMYKMIQDTGLSVFGFPTANGLGSVFIGLGPEPAAEKFRGMLKEAIAQV